jgi:general secretion pathway protein B
MSYILEALRRAERERAQGELSGVPGNAVDAEKKSRRSRLMIVLIALLAINAVVLAVFLLRPKNNNAAPAASVLQASQTPMPPAAPAFTAPAPPSEPPQPKHAERAVVEENINSLDDLGAQPEAQPNGEGAAASGSSAVEPPPRKGGHVTIAKHPLTPEIPAPTPAPAAAAPAEAQAPAGSEAEPAVPPQPAAPPSGEAKMLSDMPAAYQANFPMISLEVHVYDANPDKRFAIIGGQRYREGQTLPEGPRLLQIVPAGLLVEFHGEKVIFPIGRH